MNTVFAPEAFYTETLGWDAVWNEEEHPREPKGTPKGGEFAKKTGPRKVAGMVFVDKEGRWLFLKRKGTNFAGTWSFPGGRIDEGETAQEAAEREALEEIQVPGHGSEELANIVNENIDYTAFIKKLDYSFDPKLNWEHSEFVWMKPEEAAEKLELHPGVKDLLAHLKEQREKLVHPEYKLHPEIHPELVEVGGDEWNKRTALQLEKEYQAAKPALDKIIADAVKGAEPVNQQEVNEQAEEEEEEPELIPEEWSQLNEDLQNEVFAHIREQVHNKYRLRHRLSMDNVLSWDSAWEEGKHKRVGKGSSTGGQFGSGVGAQSQEKLRQQYLLSGRLKREYEKQYKEVGQGEHPGHGYSKEAKLVQGVIQTSNPEDAVRALFENKKVNLQQPRQVSTLIDKLAKVSAEMIKLGGKAPNFNLCNVTVGGSNLFCVDSKGIPRINMPQLDGSITGDFIKSLKKQGYTIEQTTEHAAYLRATQSELVSAKVAAVAKAIQENPKHGERLLVVSRDNYILDGHHTWAGLLGADAAKNKLGTTKMNVARVDIDIIDLLKQADDFTGGKGHKSGEGSGGEQPPPKAAKDELTWDEAWL